MQHEIGITCILFKSHKTGMMPQGGSRDQIPARHPFMIGCNRQTLYLIRYGLKKRICRDV